MNTPKTRTWKTTISMVAVALLLAGVTVAQPPIVSGGSGPRAAARAGGGHPGAREMNRLIEFLQLDDTQKAQWKAAHEAQAEAVKPIFEDLRANQKALHGALSSDTADATAVGTLMLAGRDLQKQLGALHEQLRQDLEAILSPEQLERWKAFEAANGGGRGERGRGRRGPRGGGPHGGGPGGGQG